jgi:hypothetical protein
MPRSTPTPHTPLRDTRPIRTSRTLQPRPSILPRRYTLRPLLITTILQSTCLSLVRTTSYLRLDIPLPRLGTTRCLHRHILLPRPGTAPHHRLGIHPNLISRHLRAVFRMVTACALASLQTRKITHSWLVIHLNRPLHLLNIAPNHLFHPHGIAPNHLFHPRDIALNHLFCLPLLGIRPNHTRRQIVLRLVAVCAPVVPQTRRVIHKPIRRRHTNIPPALLMAHPSTVHPSHTKSILQISQPQQDIRPSRYRHHIRHGITRLHHNITHLRLQTHIQSGVPR